MHEAGNGCCAVPETGNVPAAASDGGEIRKKAHPGGLREFILFHYDQAPNLSSLGNSIGGNIGVVVCSFNVVHDDTGYAQAPGYRQGLLRGVAVRHPAEIPANQPEPTEKDHTSYDQIASEYYDPVKHPTCSDFRRATRMLLERFILNSSDIVNPSLEVGAGRSLVAEAFFDHSITLQNLTLTDASGPMLRHSEHWSANVAKIIVAEVEHLPFVDESFDFIFACLGDPYNTRETWRSLWRVLSNSGQLFFTTPAVEWVNYFRRHHQNGRTGVAEFAIDGDRQVYVPSYVLPTDEQIELMKASGLKVGSVGSVLLSEISGGAVSSKLETPLGGNLPIVTAYVASRM